MSEPPASSGLKPVSGHPLNGAYFKGLTPYQQTCYLADLANKSGPVIAYESLFSRDWRIRNKCSTPDDDLDTMIELAPSTMDMIKDNSNIK